MAEIKKNHPFDLSRFYAAVQKKIHADGLRGALTKFFVLSFENVKVNVEYLIIHGESLAKGPKLLSIKSYVIEIKT